MRKRQCYAFPYWSIHWIINLLICAMGVNSAVSRTTRRVVAAASQVGWKSRWTHRYDSHVSWNLVDATELQVWQRTGPNIEEDPVGVLSMMTACVS